MLRLLRGSLSCRRSTLPGSWPTVAGTDQAAQAAAGRLRAPGESRCHYVHSQEDESGSGRLRPLREIQRREAGRRSRLPRGQIRKIRPLRPPQAVSDPAGSWETSGRLRPLREIQRRKDGQRQRAQIRPQNRSSRRGSMPGYIQPSHYLRKGKHEDKNRYRYN